MEDTGSIATVIRFPASNALPDAPPASIIGGVPEPPIWLTPLSRKHWDEIALSLAKHNIVNELDADMLAVYCSTFARFIELDEKLEIVGMTQKTTSGYEAETGTFTAWNKLLKPIMAYAKQLGLTPPARVAMRISDPGQVDLFDEL